MLNSTFKFPMDRNTQKCICQYNMRNGGIYINKIESIVKKFDSYALKKTGEMHSHDFYNISWIEKGEFYFSLDTVTYFVPDKSIIEILPHQLHAIENKKEISGTSINFTEEYFDTICPEWAHAIKYDILKPVHVIPIHNIVAERRIKELIAFLNNYSEKNNYSFLLDAKLYSVLTLLICTISELA